MSLCHWHAENDVYTSVVGTSKRTSGCDDVDRQRNDAELAALREQIKQLEAKLEMHNSAANSVGALGEQIEELEKKLQHKEAQLRNSQKQNEELKAITKTKEDEIASLNEQLERSKVAVQEISEELNCKDRDRVTTVS